jgi:hypothetical protein
MHASFFSYFAVRKSEECLPSFAGKLENFFVWIKNFPPKKVLFKVSPEGKRTVSREFCQLFINRFIPSSVIFQLFSLNFEPIGLSPVAWTQRNFILVSIKYQLL